MFLSSIELITIDLFLLVEISSVLSFKVSQMSKSFSSSSQQFFVHFAVLGVMGVVVCSMASPETMVVLLDFLHAFAEFGSMLSPHLVGSLASELRVFDLLKGSFNSLAIGESSLVVGIMKSSVMLLVISVSLFPGGVTSLVRKMDSVGVFAVLFSVGGVVVTVHLVTTAVVVSVVGSSSLVVVLMGSVPFGIPDLAMGVVSLSSQMVLLPPVIQPGFVSAVLSFEEGQVSLVLSCLVTIVGLSVPEDSFSVVSVSSADVS